MSENPRTFEKEKVRGFPLYKKHGGPYRAAVFFKVYRVGTSQMSRA